MLEKIVDVSGFDMKFRSSGIIPRLYRIKVKRNIFKDLSKLEKCLSGSDGSFEKEDLEIFENVAYIMEYHADKEILDTIEEWLDQIELISIYAVLPEILQIWGSNLETDIQYKKA